MEQDVEQSKDLFPDIRMFELCSPDLKESRQFCAGFRCCSKPYLHRLVLLTYPMDVSGIVLNRRMTSDLGTGILVQSVGFLSVSGFYVMFVFVGSPRVCVIMVYEGLGGDGWVLVVNGENCNK